MNNNMVHGIHKNTTMDSIHTPHTNMVVCRVTSTYMTTGCGLLANTRTGKSIRGYFAYFVF
jgi:hypothetical protein